MSAAATDEARDYYSKLNEATEAGGYHLNPDTDFAMALVDGLMTNAERYGYPLCPCRLTGGGREADRDIICPCDYRDPDLDEHDTCF